MTETPFDEPCAHGVYDEEYCPSCEVHFSPLSRLGIITGLAIISWSIVGIIVWSIAQW